MTEIDLLVDRYFEICAILRVTTCRETALALLSERLDIVFALSSEFNTTPYRIDVSTHVERITA